MLKDIPQKSNGVVWLQGDKYDRAKKVLEMYESGFAKKIIISGNDYLIGPKKRLGENNISLVNMKKYLIQNDISEKDIVIDNKSFNTKEQAIQITKLAKRNNWHKLILVSSAYHQPRVLLSFIAAFKLVGYKIKIINQSFLIAKNKMASGRTLKNDELMKEEVLKINKYQTNGDIASYKEGFVYLKALEVPKLKFRLATIADANILLRWRNDPETRKWSRNREKIDEMDHNKWLTASLKNRKRKIYIVEYNQIPAGTVRTDKKAEATELSWTVAPELRGLGIGKQMINLISNKIKGPIQAEIIDGNEASKQIAEYVEMKLCYKSKNILYYQK